MVGIPKVRRAAGVAGSGLVRGGMSAVVCWCFVCGTFIFAFETGRFFVGMLLSSAVRHHANRSPAALLEFLLAVWLAASHSHLLAALCIAIGCCSLLFADTERLTRIPVGLLNRCLENKVTSFLAIVSYSVFLLHGFLISIFGGWIVRDQFFGQLRPVFRTGIVGVITVTLTYATAWLCHVLLERPGVLLGRELDEMVRGRKPQLPGKVA